ncbi:hypothetical protein [Mycobacteroides chelonae]|nr:hypothetical protein [Mycobacteroides chelonae]
MKIFGAEAFAFFVAVYLSDTSDHGTNADKSPQAYADNEKEQAY